jgi:hypothetical protein
LDYNNSKRKNSLIAIRKEPVSFLLPNDTTGSFHIAFNDTLSANGREIGDFASKDYVTIEVMLKPARSIIRRNNNE